MLNDSVAVVGDVGCCWRCWLLLAIVNSSNLNLKQGENLHIRSTFLCLKLGQRNVHERDLDISQSTSI